MTLTVVYTTAQLLAAIGGAHAGDGIALAPGTYDNVVIYGRQFGTLYKGGPSQVYIYSQSAAHPATITNMTINNSVGLNFSGVKLAPALVSGGAAVAGGTTPFVIEASSNIVMRAMNVAGSASGTLANTSSAMYITRSSYVSIVNSSFQYLHFAIDQSFNNHVYIANNSFNHLFDDGIRGGGTSNITITGNHFTNQHVDPTDTDHPDTIQFWTAGTKTSASNITITNNTYTRGPQGGAVQGIFIKDEVGNLPYYNVNITGNNYTGTLWNGITLYDVKSGVVDSNTLNYYSDYPAALRLYDSSGMTVKGNKAASFDFRTSTNLTTADNDVIGAEPSPDAEDAFREGINVEPSPDPADDDSSEFPMGPAIDVAAAAPEPASWALMMIGLGLMGATLRRTEPRTGASPQPSRS